jgi:hypothetical protein
MREDGMAPSPVSREGRLGRTSLDAPGVPLRCRLGTSAFDVPVPLSFKRSSPCPVLGQHTSNSVGVRHGRPARIMYHEPG